ncbi:MAG: hypothetical protein M1419_08770 [Bacteroidetes bacterium]|nr:hypothetical protein [Bacteroidota bacterium]
MKIKLIIAMLIISLLSLSSVALASEHLNKAEIKFSTIKSEDKVKIETITLLLKGVSDADLSTDNKTLIVKYNPDEISSNMIIYTLTSLGYTGNLEKDTEVASNE